MCRKSLETRLDICMSISPVQILIYTGLLDGSNFVCRPLVSGLGMRLAWRGRHTLLGATHSLTALAQCAFSFKLGQLKQPIVFSDPS